MKLYDFTIAPSPRRVRMFIAEKGLDIPTVQINTREREQYGEAYVAINPNSVLPTLELDDGSTIGESVAICRYLEELHPEPSLMGRDAKERAQIEMWNRRAELEGYLMAADAVRNKLPLFEDRGLPGVTGGIPQIPELVERGKQALERFYGKLDKQLADNPFIAGEAFSIADITMFIGAEFAKWIELEIPAENANVRRWYADVSARPSAEA